MKRLLSFGILAVAGLAAARAATTPIAPIFIIDTPVTLPDAGLPTINASAFVNQSTFTVSPFSINFGVGGSSFSASSAGSLPYETFNTLYVTNEIGAVMSGAPGFRFQYTTGRIRRPASWFVNDGSILTSDYLEVKANNILSTGPLESGAQGLLRLVGNEVDLTRVSLRTGSAINTPAFGGENDGANRPIYMNAPGITDMYWGIGSNGVFLGSGPATRLNSANFNLPDPTNFFGANPSTPLHQNELRVASRLATNRVTLPKFFSFGTGSDFAAFAYTNTVDGTAAMIQVVFVRTNTFDSNLTANVRFVPAPSVAQVDGPAQVIVELKHWDFDIAYDQYNTNCFYLTDAMAVRTNLSLYRNTTPRAGTRRPSNYQLLLSQPFEWFFAVTNNTPFVNGMLDTGYVTNRVDMRYAGYSARFTNTVSDLTGLLAPVFKPTNLPGRVMLYGNRLNVDKMRVRAESTLFLQTKDLVANNLGQSDAPFVGFDVTTRLPLLQISNIAPVTVQRLTGLICAWSGQWKNRQVDPVTMTTNEVNFHVLFVDHSFQGTVPVDVYQLTAHATNIVINDNLSVSRTLLLDTRSLDVRGGLNLPAGSAWGNTNLQGILNLTNAGVITVPGTARYGTDRATPYTCIINTGTNQAAAQQVRATKFENSGLFASSAGPINIDAVTTRVHGPPVTVVTNVTTDFFGNLLTNVVLTSPGAQVRSFGSLQFRARDLSVSNSVLEAGVVASNFLYRGRLMLSVTNSLLDAGIDARNYWSATAGFEMRSRPPASSLLGTWLTTTVGINQRETHLWPAQDRGAVAEGYANNLAVGNLRINISTNSGRAVFAGPGTRAALYTDYIELFHDATNFNRTIEIANNFTIYFANANVPVSKLDGAANGRFRWVSSHTGPLSSTNITYPSGNTYTFNIALVQSKDLDSDGDGVPNADDETPIYVPEDAVLAVALLNKVAPLRAMLSWNALAFSTNTVEFKDAPSDPRWRVLTNYVHGPFTSPVQIYDPITGPGPMRVYRLRVSPAPNQ